MKDTCLYRANTQYVRAGAACLYMWKGDRHLRSRPAMLAAQSVRALSRAGTGSSARGETGVRKRWGQYFQTEGP